MTETLDKEYFLVSDIFVFFMFVNCSISDTIIAVYCSYCKFVNANIGTQKQKKAMYMYI